MFQTFKMGRKQRCHLTVMYFLLSLNPWARSETTSLWSFIKDLKMKIQNFFSSTLDILKLKNKRLVVNSNFWQKLYLIIASILMNLNFDNWCLKLNWSRELSISLFVTIIYFSVLFKLLIFTWPQKNICQHLLWWKSLGSRSRCEMPLCTARAET